MSLVSTGDEASGLNSPMEAIDRKMVRGANERNEARQFNVWGKYNGSEGLLPEE